MCTALETTAPVWTGAAGGLPARAAAGGGTASSRVTAAAAAQRAARRIGEMDTWGPSQATENLLSRTPYSSGHGNSTPFFDNENGAICDSLFVAIEIVDLSLPIVPHWRFQSSFEPLSRVEEGAHSSVTRMTLGTHAYTHVDAPSHMVVGGDTLDKVPLERFCGDALVVDLRQVADSQPISAAHLEGSGLRPDDIALLCTGLELRHDVAGRGFWQNSPYLDRSAAEWLREAGVKATGYDFPQDEVIRRLPDPALVLADFPAHEVLLGAGIVQVEYLHGLHRLAGRRVAFYALPLPLGAIDGSPCRAFAVVG